MYQLPVKVVFIVTFLTLSPYSFVAANTDRILTLESAVSQALAQDLWLEKSRLLEDAQSQLALAASERPSPRLSVAMVNLPVDGFDLNQEPMTQIRAGIVQQFPRGKSLSILTQQHRVMSEQQPVLREERQAHARRAVTELWLEAYLAQSSIALIRKDQTLFSQLLEIASSAYSSALGNVRQQELLKAELEVIRIDDVLLSLQQTQFESIAALAEWLPNLDASGVNLSTTLPRLAQLPEILIKAAEQNDKQMLATQLSSHPDIVAIEQKKRVAQSDIDLAYEAHKPQWAINASYGFRDDDEMGRSRADFFSVGLTVDLPFFSKNQIDNRVSAAKSQREVIKTEKRLALRYMTADFFSHYARFNSLQKRYALHMHSTLPTIEQNTDVVLAAYTHDDGNFVEAIESRIALLEARLAAEQLSVALHKTHNQLLFYATQSNIAEQRQ